MAKKTFPDPEIPDVGLERDRFERLLLDAFDEAVSLLQGKEFATSRRMVTRPTAGGFGPEEVTAVAMEETIWAVSDELSQQPKFGALTQYAFERGAFRRTITRDDEKMPERSVWDRFVWGELIHAPLLSALKETELEELVEAGRAHPWRVPTGRFASIAAAIADRVCERRRTLEAHCPVCLASAADESGSYELEIGTVLQRWSKKEQSTFITKYGAEYSFDDHMAFFADAEIRVRCTVEGLTDVAAWTCVSKALDRAKWALSLASEGDAFLGENPVVIRATDGARIRTLRRASGTPSLQRQISPRSIGEVAADAAEVLRRLSALGGVPGLDRALWLLGRSYNAALQRDALLDAVIGLESLLVPGPGEARYRFALHGTAVVSANHDQVHHDLRELYELRGKAAHTSKSDDSDFSRMAPRARQTLARVILGIIELIETRAIALESAKRNIGGAVQTWVSEVVIGRAKPRARAPFEA